MARRLKPRGPFQDCCCQCPHPCGKPLLTDIYRGDPPPTAGKSGHCPFPLGPGACKILFVPSKSGVCFPQSCGSPVIRSCWSLKSDSLGIPSPLVGYTGCEAWCGSQNLHNSGRISLVLLFSSLWVTYSVGIGFDFIVLAPLLPSHCKLLVFGHGVSISFWWVLVSSWQCLSNS